MYKRLETDADGIGDIKLDEAGKHVSNLIPIRSMRNVPYDSD